MCLPPHSFRPQPSGVQPWKSLPWAVSQRFPHSLDLKSLHEPAVVPVRVDLVGIDFRRKVSQAFPVQIYLKFQVGLLVVGIPAVMANECIPFDNARPYLGAEFGRCLGLATYNGTDMGLENTHDTIVNPVGVVPVHEFLLVVHGNDGFQCPFLITSQGIQQLCAVYRNQPDERTYIAHKIVEHETFTFFYPGPGLLLELDQTEIYLPGLFPERGRERKLELPAQFPDITVNDPAAVFKQIHIRGVTHFGITAGGINFHGAFVESTGAVYGGVRIFGVLPVIPRNPPCLFLRNLPSLC